MIIDNQIEGEKIQNDVNREPAKIAALSSRKIDKYEYVTGEEIFPSNQKQIIKQAFGESFWKTNKSNWRSRKKKQIKAIEDNKKQLTNTNANDYKNELWISKEREIFKNIYNKKLDKIEKLANKFNYDDLKYVTESSAIETDFSVKANPVYFFNNVKTNKITIEKTKASPEDFTKYLNIIRKGKKLKNKEKLCQTLIFFLMEEMMLSNL